MILVKEYVHKGHDIGQEISQEVQCLPDKWGCTFKVQNMWSIPVKQMGGDVTHVFVQFVGGSDIEL